MSHVFHRYDIDLYAGTMMDLILRELADSRWNIIHEGKFALYDFEYEDFVANFSFIVPEFTIEDTRADYDLLSAMIRERWTELDYPDVFYPPRFQVLGSYYVFEIEFEGVVEAPAYHPRRHK